MGNFENLIVSPDAMLKDVMEKLEATGGQIVVVCSKDKYIEGIVTDGDVRRTVLSGQPMTTQVTKVMNKSPLTIPESSPREEIRIAMGMRGVNHILLTDSQNHLRAIVNSRDLLARDILPNHAVVMAGGLGLRLRPLTKKTPKPLLHVGGKPMIETIIDQFKKSGIVTINLSINYLGEMIEDYFEDGRKLETRINYLKEQSLLGTAGSLKLLREEEIIDPLVVMNGDILTTINFADLINFHKNKNSAITMATVTKTYDIPFGVVDVELEEVIRIREKPSIPYTVNAGVYMINPDVLNYISEGERMDMPDLIDKVSDAGGRISAFPIREYWRDIGSLEDFEQAQNEYSTYFGCK